mmetsp:Transcript_60153/g.99320  ORF Transcript_60153/g.99320 Transcript_60153/m.99320 type:complete len:311 (-) Transcript_60153:110-1042(-)
MVAHIVGRIAILALIAREAIHIRRVVLEQLALGDRCQYMRLEASSNELVRVARATQVKIALATAIQSALQRHGTMTTIAAKIFMRSRKLLQLVLPWTIHGRLTHITLDTHWAAILFSAHKRAIHFLLLLLAHLALVHRNLIHRQQLRAGLEHQLLIAVLSASLLMPLVVNEERKIVLLRVSFQCGENALNIVRGFPTPSVLIPYGFVVRSILQTRNVTTKSTIDKFFHCFIGIKSKFDFVIISVEKFDFTLLFLLCILVLVVVVVVIFCVRRARQYGLYFVSTCYLLIRRLLGVLSVFNCFQRLQFLFGI